MPLELPRAEPTPASIQVTDRWMLELAVPAPDLGKLKASEMGPEHAYRRLEKGTHTTITKA